MNDWIYSLNSCCKISELKSAERYFLKILDFNLCHSYTFHFLRRISSGDGLGGIGCQVKLVAPIIGASGTSEIAMPDLVIPEVFALLMLAIILLYLFFT
jgi:hypothetical protein